MTNKYFKTLAFVVAYITIQGCAPSSYKIKSPAPSTTEYSNLDNNVSINYSLENRSIEEPFSYGVLPAKLILKGNPLDPIAFLNEASKLELRGRGINVSNNGESDFEVSINRFSMKNHRATAYSPFVTFTLLSADVATPTGNQRIGVYIRRGKVPVWSFDEIIEPTLNEPLSLLVKEFSAKLAAIKYGYMISDNDVFSLIEKIKKEPNYMDVYELGFGNNKSAIPYLVELSQSKKEYIRHTAISSLGILKAEKQVEHIQSLYSSAKSWSDKAMIIKALMDIGTDEARNFVSEKVKSFKKAKEKEWGGDIFSLYK